MKVTGEASESGGWLDRDGDCVACLLVDELLALAFSIRHPVDNRNSTDQAIRGKEVT